MGCSGSRQFSQNKFNNYKSNANIKQGQSEKILDPFNPYIKRKIQLGQIISQGENLSCYTKINNKNCLSLEKIREEDEFEDEEEKKNCNKDQNQALELRISKSLEGQTNLENKRNKKYKKGLYFSNNSSNQLHNFSNPKLGTKQNSDIYNNNLIKDFKYFYVYQNSIHQQNKEEQNKIKQNIIKDIKINRPRMTSFEKFKNDTNSVLNEPQQKNSDDTTQNNTQSFFKENSKIQSQNFIKNINQQISGNQYYDKQQKYSQEGQINQKSIISPEYRNHNNKIQLNFPYYQNSQLQSNHQTLKDSSQKYYKTQKINNEKNCEISKNKLNQIQQQSSEISFNFTESTQQFSQKPQTQSPEFKSYQNQQDIQYINQMKEIESQIYKQEKDLIDSKQKVNYSCSKSNNIFNKDRKQKCQTLILNNETQNKNQIKNENQYLKIYSERKLTPKLQPHCGNQENSSIISQDDSLYYVKNIENLDL